MKKKKNNNKESKRKDENNKYLKEKRKEFESKFNEELKIENSEYLRNLLSDYIRNAIGRADHYEEQRKWFLEINFLFLAFLGTAFFFSLSYLTNSENRPINIGLNTFLLGICLSVIVFLLVSIIIIIYYLYENKTKFENEDYFNISKQELNDFWNSPRFYKGFVPNKDEIKKDPLIFIEKLNKFTENFTNKKYNTNLLKEDIKNLFNVYVHQNNYHRIGVNIRKYTIYNILILFILFILFCLLSLIFLSY